MLVIIAKLPFINARIYKHIELALPIKKFKLGTLISRHRYAICKLIMSGENNKLSIRLFTSLFKRCQMICLNVCVKSANEHGIIISVFYTTHHSRICSIGAYLRISARNRIKISALIIYIHHIRKNIADIRCANKAIAENKAISVLYTVKHSVLYSSRCRDKSGFVKSICGVCIKLGIIYAKIYYGGLARYGAIILKSISIFVSTVLFLYKLFHREHRIKRSRIIVNNAPFGALQACL